jgi:hypothetical protein
MSAGGEISRISQARAVTQLAQKVYIHSLIPSRAASPPLCSGAGRGGPGQVFRKWLTASRVCPPPPPAMTSGVTVTWKLLPVPLEVGGHGPRRKRPTIRRDVSSFSRYSIPGWTHLPPAFLPRRELGPRFAHHARLVDQLGAYWTVPQVAAAVRTSRKRWPSLWRKRGIPKGSRQLTLANRYRHAF